jgi:aryl-alcohol dehydrogenase-like predicted oxidoreductase
METHRLILGCGNFGGIGSAPEFFGQGETEEDAFRLMDAAWQLGITAFDTADAYGGGRSETMIGSWMATRGQRPRITTKTFNPMNAGEDHGLARARVARQLESSLDRLGVASVDVYLAHAFDPDTPLEELAATFEGLVGIGLIKAWGVSNFNADQLRALLAIAKPAVVQNSYSLLERADEEEVLGLCNDFGVSYTAFSPLAGGLLAGKYERGAQPPERSRLATRPEAYEHLLTDETFAALEKLREIATRRGVEMSTLALAWLLAQPLVTAVVIGPRRLEHIEQALRAREHALSKEEAEELAALF